MHSNNFVFENFFFVKSKDNFIENTLVGIKKKFEEVKNHNGHSQVWIYFSNMVVNPGAFLW